MFASADADARDWPLASAPASVAMTVSPAPVTSNTSRALVDRKTGSSAGSTSSIPLSLRVISNAPRSSSEIMCLARSTSSSSEAQAPATASNSGWFGVNTVAPLYLSNAVPLGSTSPGIFALRQSSIMSETLVSAPFA